MEDKQNQRTLGRLSFLSMRLEDEGIYWCNASNFRFVLYEEQSPKWRINVHCKKGIEFTCRITLLYIKYTTIKLLLLLLLGNS